METKVTISLIKADVGGWPGHASVHPKLEETASISMEEAKSRGIITDYCVTHAGDDLQLLMSHNRGTEDKTIHETAWKTFEKATAVAKELKLYAAGQDLLKDTFSGNIRGMGPGIAEMEFTEREGEPLIAFMMDKTEPGAFNLPIYRAFADPFNTAGLVIDPAMHDGFIFEVWDIQGQQQVTLSAPEEMYDLLALIGAKERYVIKRVFPKKGKLPTDEPVAVICTEKLYHVAGKYVGKDDPVALVRAQSGCPALGEVLEPWAFPHLVSGWMRGSHNGPVLPVGLNQARCTRFDGPPRVVALGFQVANGFLVGPVDLFDDPAWDYTRQKSQYVAEYMRRHGPFEPHRLPLADMEYTTLPQVLKKLQGRMRDM